MAHSSWDVSDILTLKLNFNDDEYKKLKNLLLQINIKFTKYEDSTMNYEP